MDKLNTVYVNQDCIKKCISQTVQDKTINKEANRLIASAAQVLMDELLTQAAFEANSCGAENGELKVSIEHLNHVWPYVLLHY